MTSAKVKHNLAGNLLIFSIILFLSSISLKSQAVGLAYIPNDNGKVAVVNTDSNRIVYTYNEISNGSGGPFGVGISRTHQNVFLSHPGEIGSDDSKDSVTMIQPITRNAKPKIIKAGHGVHGIAVSSSEWHVYQVNAEAGSLTVLSAAGNIKATFDMKLRFPLGISTSSINGKELLFIAESKGDTVAIVDPVYGAVKARITVGRYPVGIVNSKDGKYAYVANYADGSVSSIDIENLKVIKTTQVGGHPYGIALSPDGRDVLLATQNSLKNKKGDVFILKANTLEVVGKTRVGIRPIGISSIAKQAGGYRVYVANHDSMNISVLNCKRSTCLSGKQIRMPGSPSAFGSFIAEYPKRYGYFIIKNFIHSKRSTTVLSHKKSSNHRVISQRLTNTPGEPGLMQSFFSGTLEDFASSQLLELLGIDPAPASQESVDEILTQLNAIEATLVSMQNTLNSVFKDITSILNIMNEAEVSQIDNITSSAGTGWSQFQNALQVSNNPLTYLGLNDLVNGSQASAPALSALAILLTDSYVSSLANLANQASNYSGESVLTPYISAANGILTANISQALGQGSNIMNSVGTWQPPGQDQSYSLNMFDTYNNALLNQYVRLVLALQRIYTIESSVLYLQANLPQQFGDVLLAEPNIGLTTPENYADNAATLLNIYTNRVDSLDSTFYPAFVSDSVGTLLNNSIVAPGDYPKKSGGLLSINGSWNNTSNLYVWQGLLPPGITGYSGGWDGTSLTVQGNSGTDVQSYTLNITKACFSGDSGPVISFWNLQGWNPQLQCLPRAPVSSDGYYALPYVYTYFANWDPNAYFYFNFSGDIGNIQQQLISQGYPPILISQSPLTYYTPTSAGSTFSGNVGLVAPNGFAGQYIFGGQSQGKTFTRDWSINLSCPSTGNCYYINQSDNTAGGICLGGNQISISGQANGNTATISYGGSCPPLVD